MNKDIFIEECKKLNIIIDEDIYSKFDIYYNELVDWNKKFNMTNILEKNDVFLLHFYDSLCLSKVFDKTENITLCDFGTGAGFPGMVIAILFNKVNVTLIESNQKKCLFLNHIKEILNLRNVNVVCDRIENYGLKNREKYDFVTCRAVTSIPMIVELSTSIIKVNGKLVPLKTNSIAEIEENYNLYDEIGLKYIDNIEYYLPINNAERSIPIFIKTRKTSDKYPQMYNKLLKKYKKA